MAGVSLVRPAPPVPVGCVARPPGPYHARVPSPRTGTRGSSVSTGQFATSTWTIGLYNHEMSPPELFGSLDSRTTRRSCQPLPTLAQY